MNERIKELAEQCTTIYNSTTFPVDKDFDHEKFAELIVKDIIENLSFHGHDDAVSQIQWHAANKYGLK